MMLDEEEIIKIIGWLEQEQERNFKKLKEIIEEREMWRISDALDKIAETRGKIFAFKLVLNKDDE